MVIAAGCSRTQHFIAHKSHTFTISYLQLFTLVFRPPNSFSRS